MSSYPARRYYERVAEASGFPIAALERVFRQAALLGELVAGVPGELLLRGGTALNLLHLEAPRLSVDLDLDFVGSAVAEEAQQRRPALLAELEELAGEADYRVERSRQSYALADRWEAAGPNPEAHRSPPRGGGERVALAVAQEVAANGLAPGG